MKNVAIGVASGILIGVLTAHLLKKKCHFCLEYPEIKIWDINYQDRFVKFYWRVDGREIEKVVRLSDPDSSQVLGDYTLITESDASKGVTWLEIRNNKDKEIEDNVVIDYKNKSYNQ